MEGAALIARKVVQGGGCERDATWVFKHYNMGISGISGEDVRELNINFYK